ncbi:hypothetical protein J3R82DRAFT_7326 [Butyriboletus roseoflavus]|nr:hypothetical protein J3R82DRAFT_7326 [Butyriboletus roseoflavus]
MKQQLAPTTNWKESDLKATILLKWMLFMTETRYHNPFLENQEGFKTNLNLRYGMPSKLVHATYASTKLHKIKQRREDVLASVHTDQSRMFRSATPLSGESESQSAPWNNVTSEHVLQFCGATPLDKTYALLYMKTMEISMGKLPLFLQWAVWSTQVHDMNITMALYDILSDLCKGLAM